MLEVARAKLQREPNLSPRARLVQADMRDFELGSTFGLAVVAVKSFAYLTARADQQRCLERIAAHLRQGGLLAIDLLHPRPEWVGAAQGSVRDDLVSWSAERRVTLSRVESVVATDLAAQIRTIRSIYELIDEHGVPIVKRIVEWPYRYIFRFEAEHLLERAGFAIEATYGGYQREPFTTDSTSMIFLARRV
jgi:SAM-dependent methyltransferase